MGFMLAGVGQDQERCFVCGTEATFELSSTLDLCRACALRVADLAADPSENFWASVVAPDESAHAPEDGVSPARQRSVTCFDSDRAFEEFKSAVATAIPKEDADSHLNLAEAYSEMGLYLDARREAAAAIASPSTKRTTAAALRLLLTPPLLPKDALARLRERLLRSVN